MSENLALNVNFSILDPVLGSVLDPVLESVLERVLGSVLDPVLGPVLGPKSSYLLNRRTYWFPVETQRGVWPLPTQTLQSAKAGPCLAPKRHQTAGSMAGCWEIAPILGKHATPVLDLGWSNFPSWRP